MTLYVYLIYYLLLLLLALTLLRRYRLYAEPAYRIFNVMVGLSIITEFLALLSGYFWGTNLIVYNIFTLIDFVLTAWYFEQLFIASGQLRRPCYLPAVALITGIGFAVAEEAWQHHFSYLLLLEALVLVVAAFLLARSVLLFQKSKLQLRRMRHFWIASLLLFHKVLGLWSWLVYEYFLTADSALSGTLNVLLLCFGMLSYGLTLLVYLYMPKLKFYTYGY